MKKFSLATLAFLTSAHGVSLSNGVSTYKTSDDLVDSSLCGNGSAKSLSGYFSVKGSSSDKNSDKSECGIPFL